MKLNVGEYVDVNVGVGIGVYVGVNVGASTEAYIDANMPERGVKQLTTEKESIYKAYRYKYGQEKNIDTVKENIDMVKK